MDPRRNRNRAGSRQPARSPHGINREELHRYLHTADVLRRRVTTLLQFLCTPSVGELPEARYVQSSDLLTNGIPLPPRLDILLGMPPASLECQIKHAWNPEDCSPFIYIKDDQLTFYKSRNWTTDYIRGKVGFTKGLHVWEINWVSGQKWKHTNFGVATENAPLRTVDFQNIISRNNNSWTWNIGQNKLYHDSKKTSGVTYPAFLEPGENFSVTDKLLVVLDMDSGTLSFIADGQYLGIAFEGLHGHKLYPYAGATWGYCEVTMKYLGGLDPEPQPLMDLCRYVIRKRVGQNQLEDHVAQFNIPHTLRNYLLHRNHR